VCRRPDAHPALGGLSDASWAVRRAAALSLGKLGWQPTSEVERICYQVAEGRYSYAAKAGAAAVKPLIRALVSPDLPQRDSSELWDITKALASLRDPVAVPPLLQVLDSNPGGEFWGVCWALGQLGDASAVEPLARVLGVADGHCLPRAVPMR